jgi:hypothetical protein
MIQRNAEADQGFSENAHQGAQKQKNVCFA